MGEQAVHAGVDPFACDHERTELRLRTLSNGASAAYRQCLRCGQSNGSAKKPFGAEAILPKWDTDLEEEWKARRQAYWDKSRDDFQTRLNREAAEWRDRYQRHLASDAWRDLRNRVYARCKGICEGCMVKPMRHVHHLTYDRLGREMLFDLVGVCVECHESIHGRKIGGEA